MSVLKSELDKKLSEIRDQSKEIAVEIEKISAQSVYIDEELKFFLRRIETKNYSYLMQDTASKIKQEIFDAIKIKFPFSRIQITDAKLRLEYDAYVALFWKKLKEDIECRSVAIYEESLKRAEEIQEILKQLASQNEMREIQVHFSN